MIETFQEKIDKAKQRYQYTPPDYTPPILPSTTPGPPGMNEFIPQDPAMQPVEPSLAPQNRPLFQDTGPAYPNLGPGALIQEPGLDEQLENIDTQIIQPTQSGGFRGSVKPPVETVQNQPTELPMVGSEDLQPSQQYQLPQADQMAGIVPDNDNIGLQPTGTDPAPVPQPQVNPMEQFQDDYGQGEAPPEGGISPTQSAYLHGIAEWPAATADFLTRGTPLGNQPGAFPTIWELLGPKGLVENQREALGTTQLMQDNPVAAQLGQLTPDVLTLGSGLLRSPTSTGRGISRNVPGAPENPNLPGYRSETEIAPSGFTEVAPGQPGYGSNNPLVETSPGQSQLTPSEEVPQWMQDVEFTPVEGITQQSPTGIGQDTTVRSPTTTGESPPTPTQDYGPPASAEKITDIPDADFEAVLQIERAYPDLPSTFEGIRDVALRFAGMTPQRADTIAREIAARRQIKTPAPTSPDLPQISMNDLENMTQQQLEDFLNNARLDPPTMDARYIGPPKNQLEPPQGLVEPSPTTEGVLDPSRTNQLEAQPVDPSLLPKIKRAEDLLRDKFNVVPPMRQYTDDIPSDIGPTDTGRRPFSARQTTVMEPTVVDELGAVVSERMQPPPSTLRSTTVIEPSTLEGSGLAESQRMSPPPSTLRSTTVLPPKSRRGRTRAQTLDSSYRPQPNQKDITPSETPDLLDITPESPSLAQQMFDSHTPSQASWFDWQNLASKILLPESSQYSTAKKFLLEKRNYPLQDLNDLSRKAGPDGTIELFRKELDRFNEPLPKGFDNLPKTQADAQAKLDQSLGDTIPQAFTDNRTAFEATRSINPAASGIETFGQLVDPKQFVTAYKTIMGDFDKIPVSEQAAYMRSAMGRMGALVYDFYKLLPDFGRKIDSNEIRSFSEPMAEVAQDLLSKDVIKSNVPKQKLQAALDDYNKAKQSGNEEELRKASQKLINTTEMVIDIQGE